MMSPKESSLQFFCLKFCIVCNFQFSYQTFSWDIAQCSKKLPVGYFDRRPLVFSRFWPFFFDNLSIPILYLNLKNVLVSSTTLWIRRNDVDSVCRSERGSREKESRLKANIVDKEGLFNLQNDKTSLYQRGSSFFPFHPIHFVVD